MPKSKKLSSYPLEFWQILETLRTKPEGLTITTEDEKEAEALRFELYGFYNALETAVSDSRMSEAKREECRQYEMLARGFALRLVAEGLQFQPRSENKFAKLLKGGIEETLDFTQPPVLPKPEPEPKEQEKTPYDRLFSDD